MYASVRHPNSIITVRLYELSTIKTYDSAKGPKIDANITSP